MAKKLMKGNEALGEAAIAAGALNYFAYPITPQSEVAEYLCWRLPQVGGNFVQAESEVAVGNMLFGAASTGKRVFTTSSSPGVSLMQEAISYMAGAHLPVVLLNIMRGGPGLGGILPAQSDYFQAVKGGGHGDYRLVVLAPASVQEAVDLMIESFDIAEKYLGPVMIVADGMIGQMMESVEFPKEYCKENDPTKSDWALNGADKRKPRIVKSLFLDGKKLEENCLLLEEKYKEIRKNEVKYELYKVSKKNKILITAFGTMARICQTAIDELEEEKISVGLMRPISLYPFPEKEMLKEAQKSNILAILDIEMSTGQMVEDVERCTRSIKPIEFFGRTGGIVPTPEEVKDKVRELIKKYKVTKKKS
ncbi:MAG: 3-methyl-2-oxobutanoate dehydrogenase subunit VorB [candidate division Zixibacteria bacterium]|nr:3-methyl-2-oxobutanoate dehydrogenase subunit VorB [candidate division Zixibacteria bacterium]